MSAVSAVREAVPSSSSIVACSSTAAGLIVLNRPGNRSRSASSTANELPSWITTRSNPARPSAARSVRIVHCSATSSNSACAKAANSRFASCLWNAL